MSHDRQDIVIQIRLDRTATRRALGFGVIAALVAVPSYLLAGAVTWPAVGYPFQPGTPISSSEVNAAFAALEAAVDANVWTEADVEGAITDGAVDLHAGTTMEGEALLTASVLGQSCPTGQVMTGIGSDGTIVCAVSPAEDLFASSGVSIHGVTIFNSSWNSLGSVTVETVAGRTYEIGIGGGWIVVPPQSQMTVELRSDGDSIDHTFIRNPSSTSDAILPLAGTAFLYTPTTSGLHTYSILATTSQTQAGTAVVGPVYVSEK